MLEQIDRLTLAIVKSAVKEFIDAGGTLEEWILIYDMFRKPPPDRTDRDLIGCSCG
jgi:hypothetical protein